MSLAWVAQQILDPHQGRAPVTPRAELVYRLVRESGGMTYRGLMLATGRSRSTVERYTDEALAAGLVKIRMGGPGAIPHGSSRHEREPDHPAAGLPGQCE